MSNPGPATTTSTHPSNLGTNQALRLLASAQGVSLGQTGDAATLPINNSTTYSVYQVIVTNASADVSTGYVGVFTAPSGGGTAIVSNAVLTGVTGSTVVSQRTVASTAAQTSQNLYLRVGTAVTGTVDVYVFGYDFSQSS
jgi:hypothetical protein